MYSVLDIILQIDAKEAIDFIANRDPSWDKKLVNAVINIGFLFLLVYIGWKGYRFMSSDANKHKSLKDVLTEDPRGILNKALVISSALELAALTTMALDRNVTLIAALTRYLILGFFEALAAYVAMDQISKVTEDGVFHIKWKIGKEVWKTNAANVKNDLFNVVGAIVSFIISFACTYAIFILYMEAEGATHLISSDTFVPDVQFNNNRILEWGIIVTIFCTPIITLVNVYFEVQKMSKEKKKFNLNDKINKKVDKNNSEEENLKLLIKNSTGVKRDNYQAQLDELLGK